MKDFGKKRPRTDSVFSKKSGSYRLDSRQSEATILGFSLPEQPLKNAAQNGELEVVETDV